MKTREQLDTFFTRITWGIFSLLDGVIRLFFLEGQHVISRSRETEHLRWPGIMTEATSKVILIFLEGDFDHRKSFYAFNDARIPLDSRKESCFLAWADFFDHLYFAQEVFICRKEKREREETRVWESAFNLLSKSEESLPCSLTISAMKLGSKVWLINVCKNTSNGAWYWSLEDTSHWSFDLLNLSELLELPLLLEKTCQNIGLERERRWKVTQVTLTYWHWMEMILLSPIFPRSWPF